MKNFKVLIYIVLTLTLLFGINCLYILDTRTTAVITQFGRVVDEISEAGLKFKLPIIQKATIFDNRIQNLTFRMSENSEVVAFDQKTMKVDAFAKYQVVNATRFYETMYNDSKFRIRLESIIESGIREAIGRVKFTEILGSKRNKIRDSITEIVSNNIKNFGVKIVDIRLIRVNLPDQAKKSVNQRMITDRQKEAREIRAIGRQESDIIKARSNKEKAIIIAEAEKNAKIIKGQGEAKAISITAKAYARDKDFYEFYKSLDIYKNSLGKNSSLVISLNNKFFKYFD